VGEGGRGREGAKGKRKGLGGREGREFVRKWQVNA
jgi:hypothetical protein